MKRFSRAASAIPEGLQATAGRFRSMAGPTCPRSKRVAGFRKCLHVSAFCSDTRTVNPRS